MFVSLQPHTECLYHCNISLEKAVLMYIIVVMSPSSIALPCRWTILQSFWPRQDRNEGAANKGDQEWQTSDVSSAPPSCLGTLALAIAALSSRCRKASRFQQLFVSLDALQGCCLWFWGPSCAYSQGPHCQPARPCSQSYWKQHSHKLRESFWSELNLNCVDYLEKTSISQQLP